MLTRQYSWEPTLALVEIAAKIAAEDEYSWSYLSPGDSWDSALSSALATPHPALSQRFEAPKLVKGHQHKEGLLSHVDIYQAPNGYLFHIHKVWCKRCRFAVDKGWPQSMVDPEGILTKAVTMSNWAK